MRNENRWSNAFKWAVFNIWIETLKKFQKWPLKSGAKKSAGKQFKVNTIQRQGIWIANEVPFYRPSREGLPILTLTPPEGAEGVELWVTYNHRNPQVKIGVKGLNWYSKRLKSKPILHLTLSRFKCDSHDDYSLVSPGRMLPTIGSNPICLTSLILNIMIKGCGWRSQIPDVAHHLSSKKRRITWHLRDEDLSRLKCQCNIIICLQW